MRTSISALLNPTPSLVLPPPVPSSPSSSSSAPSSPLRPPDHLRRNRDISSRHRQAQRQALASAQADLASLRASHKTLASHTASLIASGALPSALPHSLLASSPSPIALNTHDVFQPVSPATARILNTPAVSEPVGLVLLEIVAIRRGVAAVCPTGLTPAEARRFTSHEYDALAGGLAYDAGTGLPVPHAVYGARLEELCALYVSWDAHEMGNHWFRAHGYAAADAEDDQGETDGEGEDAGDGAAVKRCRRCRVLKTAGSGHRRSHCEDGMLVNSDAPFLHPASPLDACHFPAAGDSSDTTHGDVWGYY